MIGFKNGEDLQSDNNGRSVFETDLVVCEAAERGANVAAQVFTDEPVVNNFQKTII